MGILKSVLYFTGAMYLIGGLITPEVRRSVFPVSIRDSEWETDNEVGEVPPPLPPRPRLI